MVLELTSEGSVSQKRHKTKLCSDKDVKMHLGFTNILGRVKAGPSDVP